MLRDQFNDITTAVDLLILEYQKATLNFYKFNSTHEGYAVLKEEMDELWDTIKQNQSKETMKKEAIRIATMAIRFVLDCC